MSDNFLIRNVRNLGKSIFDLISGKRNISLYYSTVTFSDSIIALFCSIALLLRLPVDREGRTIFKKLIQEKFGTSEVYFYGSARSALYALLKSLELESGSEVIITGFTCEVVPNAVIQAGLKPVYADIDPQTFCITPESVHRIKSNRTRVLIIQHTFGIPADIDPLLAFAREYDLYVVEDCAVSLGSYYKGKLTGTFGDAAIFSFELSKTITSCRGGMLLLNTSNLNAKEKHDIFYQTVPEQHLDYSSQILLQLGLSGIFYRPIIFNLGKYVIALMFKWGYFKKSTSDQEMKAGVSDNYILKLSDQQATILCRQFNRLDHIRNQSSRTSRYYYEKLKEVPGLIPYRCPDDGPFNLIRYPILTKNRERMSEEFQACGIDLGLWFTAPLSSPDVDHSLFFYTKGECPVAERIAGQICNLPTNVRLKKKDLLKITDIARKVS